MADVITIGYCRSCGKALGQAEAHTAQGGLYCAEHAPGEPPQILYATASRVGEPPPPLPLPPAGPSAGSPPLAFFLGIIPGVGAVYNGQYAKGLVHVLILGLIIAVLANDAAGGFEPLFGFLIPCFWFYMCFEAYHTAKARLEGRQVDEFSSLTSHHGGRMSRFPMLAAILILFGVVFLLNNLDILALRHVLRYWPVLLILAGAYMLYEKFAGEEEPRDPAA